MRWLDDRLGREVHMWLSIDLGGEGRAPVSIFGDLHHWREANPRPELRPESLEHIEDTYTVGRDLAIDFNDLPDAFVVGDMADAGASDLLEVRLSDGIALCIAETPPSVQD